MVVKTYRGVLADGGQDRIPLSTKDGSKGYRITKFQIISTTPGVTSVEQITKVYKSFQTSIDAVINFTDSQLLAAAYWSVSDTSQRGVSTIIFDGEIFNQDIFVTYKAGAGSETNSYYIEVEQLRLNHNENMNATLKAFKGQ
jgi:hypothetical protein